MGSQSARHATLSMKFRGANLYNTIDKGGSHIHCDPGLVSAIGSFEGRKGRNCEED
jgi:hypothetical protein